MSFPKQTGLNLCPTLSCQEAQRLGFALLAVVWFTVASFAFAGLRHGHVGSLASGGVAEVPATIAR